MARMPDQIGKYDVVERIGKGGMGMVYKARHPTLDRFVILKKLTISGDAAIRERFRREAEIMIDFRTDYVVDVYDHFKQGSNDYIVLEYVDGIALDELLDRERYLDSELALLIARDCFRGLDYVHGKGVVHRDVKPGNVLIGRDGSVKLLDFGIASRVTGFDDELTREGMTLGTVAYIAPEQIERSRDVDRRADIYSAGAMLYEVATGRKAFSGGFNPETVNRIQRGRYRRPRRVNPGISPLASRIIRRCMRRNPARRYQSADRVVKILDAYFARRAETDLRSRLAGLAGGDATSGTARPRRRRWGRLAAALFVLVGAIGVVGWTTGTAQRVVLGSTHAVTQLEVRLRKTERRIREHLIRPDLAVVDGASRTDVPLPLPLLHPVRALETPDYVVLRSRLFTVPAGRYEMTVRVEDSLVKESRSLAPAAAEQSTPRFVARWDPSARPSVDLAVDVYDSFSDESIPDADLDIEIDGRWVDLVRRGDAWATRSQLAGSLPVGESTAFGRGAGPHGTAPSPSTSMRFITRPLRIEPGETVSLRASHPDYLPAPASIKTSERSQGASVRIGLAAKPATLLVNNRVEGAELFVDGSDRVVDPGAEPRFSDLPQLRSGVTEIQLRPGMRRISVRASGAGDEIGLTLAPGSRTVLRVSDINDGIDLVVVEGSP